MVLTLTMQRFLTQVYYYPTCTNKGYDGDFISKTDIGSLVLRQVFHDGMYISKQNNYLILFRRSPYYQNFFFLCLILSLNLQVLTSTSFGTLLSTSVNFEGLVQVCPSPQCRAKHPFCWKLLSLGLTPKLLLRCHNPDSSQSAIVCPV